MPILIAIHHHVNIDRDKKKKLTKIERKMRRERSALELLRDVTRGDLVCVDDEESENEVDNQDSP